MSRAERGEVPAGGGLRHDPRRGALLMLGATLVFTLGGGLIKWSAVSVPFPEIMFFRNLLAVPVVVLFALRRGIGLRTSRFGGHLARALTGLLAMTCSFWALTLMPLADQTALTYTTPLFVILLSVPFLGERPGWRRWLGVGVGFVGVLVVALSQGTRAEGVPGAPAVPGWAYGVALAHGLFAGLTTLLVRQLSATEASATIVLWQSLLMTALTALALPFVWITPTWTEFLPLLGVGVLGALGQVLLTEAYASAQVSSLGSYSYTALIWAMLIGWVAFGEAPGWAMLAGSALIVGAGLAVLRGEMGSERSR